MQFCWRNRKQSNRTMENINYERDNDNRANWWKWRWKSQCCEQCKSEDAHSSDFVTNDSNKCNLNCNIFQLFSDNDTEKQSRHSSPMSSSVTFFNFLVILILTFLLQTAVAFPTSDCDWTGSGSRETIVQAVYLRCQKGQITWESPRGGLRVNISPPTFMLPLSASKSSSLPYRLCLESTEGKNYRVFLEQSDSSAEKRLLPFVAPDTESTVADASTSSKCYRISTTTATLYVESMHTQLSPEDKANSGEEILPGGHYNKLLLHSPLVAGPNHNEDQNHKTNPNGNDGHHHSHTIKQQVKISYEIELIREESESNSNNKSPGRISDDECRPCSDDEVLQLYCVADVVARGEILSVSPSHSRKNSDTIHIKSDLVVHQNHPVFKPLKPGNKNLQKFLSEDVHIFDENAPKKASNSKGVSKTFAGIVSHPRKCSAQSGPGEFLWLIKLSFGRPKIGCVVYWDKWVEMAKTANEEGTSNCPFVF